MTVCLSGVKFDGALEDGFYRINTTDSSYGGYGGSIEIIRITGVFPVATAIEGPEQEVPAGFWLQSAYPNPINPITTIGINLPATVHVSLAVYDLLGHEVLQLESGTVSAGTHTYKVDASTLSSGRYLYRLEAPGFSQSRQMVLLK